MTSNASSSRGRRIPHPRLPWILSAVFFALYLVTLNHGPGLLTLSTTAKIMGWDWTPMVQYPIYYLLTLPVRVLPVGLQVITMNVMSAAIGALTLGLLARSVQLLPQDRTRDQRERQRSELGVLTGAFAWLPPVGAVAVCGLQLLFWQNATNASTEVLDLFIFAWIIRELLEFRLDQKENRLLRVALIYGIGVTNNFALIALFPFTLGALIWILGVKFFRLKLILKLLLAGIIGLLPYLLLPAVAASSSEVELTFWESLKTNIVAQKSMLGIGWNRRLFVFLMCLGSLFPLILIGIRWKSNVGDTSAAGNLTTRVMFPVLTLLFIAAAGVINLHFAFAEKAQLETGMGFFSLYYLSALVVGYSIGYLIVVFGREPMRSRRRVNPLFTLLQKAMLGVAFLAPAALIVLLLRDNYPQIQNYNRSLLAKYTTAMARELPSEGSIVLSDDPVLLHYVRHRLERDGTADQHWLIHSQSLDYPGYHRVLRDRIGNAWPELPESMVFDGNVEDSYIARLIFTKGQERPVRYLHASFGYFFERMYPRMEKRLMALESFPKDQIRAPIPGESEISDQSALLESDWSEDLEALAEKLPLKQASIADQYLANVESRRLNEFGVTLQYADRFSEATKWFERASQLNTNNASALINLEYNRFHQSEKTNSFQLSESTTQIFRNYRNNLLVVLNSGGLIDTPDFCLLLGTQFAIGNNYRQSVQQYLRALDLTPDNQLARAQIARTFLQAQSPDRALETIREIRATVGPDGLNELAQIDLMSLEASALMTKGQTDEAVSLLEAGLNKFPESPFMRDTAAQTYLDFGPYNTNLLGRAEPLIAQQIERNPTNTVYRFNAASLALMQGDWSTAIDGFDAILEETPDYVGARFNRALANLRADKLDAARADYEVLIAQAPHDFKLHYGLGQIAVQQSRNTEAVEHFQAYLKTAPRNTPEYTNITERLEQLLSQ